jgi:arabinose-5-phosphate isomerase
MSSVLITMTAKRFGCVGVIEAETLTGIITDGDLRRHMAPGLLDQIAGDVMTPAPMTIRSQILAIEALGIMNEQTITSLFVVDDGHLVGILHIHDILNSGVA